MTEILNTVWTLTLLMTLATVAIVTGRLVRDDRPSTPPGSPIDWRDDAWRWTNPRIR